MFAKAINQIPSRLSRASSWKAFPAVKPDPILTLNAKYVAEQDPRKVNLTIGAYRTEEGQPWILPAVRMAQELIHQDPHNLEYSPMRGDPEFIDGALKVALGQDSVLVAERRIAGCQTLSGGGAFNNAATFFKKFWNGPSGYHGSKPSWPIHESMIAEYDEDFSEYPYFDAETGGLNYDGMIDYMERQENGSRFILHVCGHNPTGVDLTVEQWKGVREVFARRGHYAIFDMAYQGFVSGDLETDAISLRLWQEKDMPFMILQSFAKNLGLYGLRTGTCGISTSNPTETQQIEEWLAKITRNKYCNPPRYGAEIAKRVFANPEIRAQWDQDLLTMSSRISKMRELLVKNLAEVGNKKDWSHVVKQRGMFAFTGLNAEQSQRLMDKHKVYLTLNGRISVAGLNENNVEYVAKAFDEVTRFTN